jgi:hypothetical protein
MNNIYIIEFNNEKGITVIEKTITNLTEIELKEYHANKYGITITSIFSVTQ